MVIGNRPQKPTTTVKKPTPAVKKPTTTVKKPTPAVKKPTTAAKKPTTSTTNKKKKYPANRYDMTERKITNKKITLATKKIPPPKGWSLDCWNLFQEKRSKLKSDEYLDMFGYFYYGAWLKDRIVNEKYKICCSETDKSIMDNVIAWLKQYE